MAEGPFLLRLQTPATPSDPILQDVLCRAQCADMSVNQKTGEPSSILADIHQVHHWFVGADENWCSHLRHLAKLGYLEFEGAWHFRLTDKGLRAQVTSPGFSEENIQAHQETLAQIAAYFERIDLA